MEPWISSYSGKPRIFQRIILIASLVILLGLSATLILISQVDRISEEILENPLHILLIGVDQEKIDENGEKERPRTDTMLLMIFSPAYHKLGVFSIPRDSLVEIPGFGTDRINMAYVYGGYPLTKQMVEEVTGLPIHRYAMINFEGFKELVDLVGGVEITVDKRMLYTDQSAGLKIDLEPGKQVLMGEDALGYVRFRRDKLGDITRIQRQQEFLKALAGKLRQEGMIAKVFSILKIARKNLKTDLKPTEIVALYRLSRRLDLSEVLITTLPGEFSGPYWKLHKKEIDLLLESFRPK